MPDLVAVSEYNPSDNNIEWVAQQAAKIFRLHGGHMPILQAYGGKQLAIIGMVFENTDEKYAAMRAAGNALAYLHDEIGYLTDLYMIAEAWMIKRKALPAAGGDAPSQAPDRMEILGIVGWHVPQHGGPPTCEGVYYEVVREGQIEGQQNTDEGQIIDMIRHEFGESGGTIELGLINELLASYSVCLAAEALLRENKN